MNNHNLDKVSLEIDALNSLRKEVSSISDREQIQQPAYIDVSPEEYEEMMLHYEIAQEMKILFHKSISYHREICELLEQYIRVPNEKTKNSISDIIFEQVKDWLNDLYQQKLLILKWLAFGERQWDLFERTGNLIIASDNIGESMIVFYQFISSRIRQNNSKNGFDSFFYNKFFHSPYISYEKIYHFTIMGEDKSIAIYKNLPELPVPRLKLSKVNMKNITDSDKVLIEKKLRIEKGDEYVEKLKKWTLYADWACPVDPFEAVMCEGCQ